MQRLLDCYLFPELVDIVRKYLLPSEASCKVNKHIMIDGIAAAKVIFMSRFYSANRQNWEHNAYDQSMLQLIEHEKNIPLKYLLMDVNDSIKRGTFGT